ncbi:hypothetical protein RvY_14504 [Ramazzottius varieornatus]|uniref:Uncharacterized protein n=1 Tax=Ramazzottius varieornatus TaxID=947166 RepID=A0A1D1VTA6_RAMVA|nr:hypothetical protein RvY_14504 [Ramazzottius varieornatus]
MSIQHELLQAVIQTVFHEAIDHTLRSQAVTNTIDKTVDRVIPEHHGSVSSTNPHDPHHSAHHGSVSSANPHDPHHSAHHETLSHGHSLDHGQKHSVHYGSISSQMTQPHSGSESGHESHHADPQHEHADERAGHSSGISAGRHLHVHDPYPETSSPHSHKHHQFIESHDYDIYGSHHHTQNEQEVPHHHPGHVHGGEVHGQHRHAKHERHNRENHKQKHDHKGNIQERNGDTEISHEGDETHRPEATESTVSEHQSSQQGSVPSTERSDHHGLSLRPPGHHHNHAHVHQVKSAENSEHKEHHYIYPSSVQILPPIDNPSESPRSEEITIVRRHHLVHDPVRHGSRPVKSDKKSDRRKSKKFVESTPVAIPSPPEVVRVHVRENTQSITIEKSPQTQFPLLHPHHSHPGKHEHTQKATSPQDVPPVTLKPSRSQLVAKTPSKTHSSQLHPTHGNEKPVAHRHSPHRSHHQSTHDGYHVETHSCHIKDDAKPEGTPRAPSVLEEETRASVRKVLTELLEYLRRHPAKADVARQQILPATPSILSRKEHQVKFKEPVIVTEYEHTGIQAVRSEQFPSESTHMRYLPSTSTESNETEETKREPPEPTSQIRDTHQSLDCSNQTKRGTSPSQRLEPSLNPDSPCNTHLDRFKVRECPTGLRSFLNRHVGFEDPPRWRVSCPGSSAVVCDRFSSRARFLERHVDALQGGDDVTSDRLRCLERENEKLKSSVEQLTAENRRLQQRVLRSDLSKYPHDAEMDSSPDNSQYRKFEDVLSNVTSDLDLLHKRSQQIICSQYPSDKIDSVRTKELAFRAKSPARRAASPCRPTVAVLDKADETHEPDIMTCKYNDSSYRNRTFPSSRTFDFSRSEYLSSGCLFQSVVPSSPFQRCRKPSLKSADDIILQTYEERLEKILEKHRHCNDESCLPADGQWSKWLPK